MPQIRFATRFAPAYKMRQWREQDAENKAAQQAADNEARDLRLQMEAERLRVEKQGLELRQKANEIATKKLENDMIAAEHKLNEEKAVEEEVSAMLRDIAKLDVKSPTYPDDKLLVMANHPKVSQLDRVQKMLGVKDETYKAFVTEKQKEREAIQAEREAAKVRAEAEKAGATVSGANVKLPGGSLSMAQPKPAPTVTPAAIGQMEKDFNTYRSNLTGAQSQMEVYLSDPKSTIPPALLGNVEKNHRALVDAGNRLKQADPEKASHVDEALSSVRSEFLTQHDEIERRLNENAGHAQEPKDITRINWLKKRLEYQPIDPATLKAEPAPAAPVATPAPVVTSAPVAPQPPTIQPVSTSEATLSQPAAVPATPVATPSAVAEPAPKLLPLPDEHFNAAAAAIKGGKDPAAVAERLRSYGYDPTRLGELSQ